MALCQPYVTCPYLLCGKFSAFIEGQVLHLYVVSAKGQNLVSYAQAYDGLSILSSVT